VLTNNYNGIPDAPVSPLKGIQDRAGAGVTVTYAPGCELPVTGKRWKPEPVVPPDSIDPAVAAAHAADVAVVFVGTDADVEDETNDRKTLALVGDQEKLVEAVLAANPRTAVVEMSGGPLTVPWIANNAPALLQAWWPGEEGGHAIADVLFGDVNPAGRLPHTVYASESQVPPQDEYDISKGFTYMYVKGAPLFPFGYGLSYTKFDYSNLQVSPSRIAGNGEVAVSVDVKNSGGRPGDEVVQLYVHDSPAGTPPPAERLRGFQRVTLAPGETKKVTMRIPEEKLAYWNDASHAYVVQPGVYDVMVGASSADIRVKQSFVVSAAATFAP
jgi:beta-glucosidase